MFINDLRTIPHILKLIYNNIIFYAGDIKYRKMPPKYQNTGLL